VCVDYCDAGIVFGAICMAAIILRILLEGFAFLFLESCCKMLIKMKPFVDITGWALRGFAKRFIKGLRTLTSDWTSTCPSDLLCHTLIFIYKKG
jgi:hypothetical protein